MRYIMAAFWAILITGVVSYVLNSMSGATFDLTDSLILAAVFSIVIFFLGDVALKTEKE